jgi:hypothetical protein
MWEKGGEKAGERRRVVYIDFTTLMRITRTLNTWKMTKTGLYCV